MSKRTISFACAIIVSLGGCARRNYFAAHPPIARTALNVQSPTAENARSLTMFTGEGQPIVWNDVLDAAAWADVIILGEQHDDAVGHAVQLAVVQDVMARWPRSAPGCGGASSRSPASPWSPTSSSAAPSPSRTPRRWV